jgi:hypothetical protein
MADVDPHAHDGVTVSPASPAADAEILRVDRIVENHAPARDPSTVGPAPHAPGEPDDRSGLDRAEALVDHVAARASSLTADWAKKFLRLGSRAREAAQDFWAEVQDFRQDHKR